MSSAASPNKRQQEPIEAQPLELSLNPEDGSLMTMPLSRLLLATTDGLYTDLYNIAHGELEVVGEDAGGGGGQAAASSAALRKERMSNLSFAQRRHELAWRLALHSKALSHVSSLTASSASTNFAHYVQTSTKALQHARTAWVQADEAQDALYFFHAQLFPARQAPHDIYGALELLKRGQWCDLPNDLKLVMDRYEASQESKWSGPEVKERWHMSVREKLVRGEVGWMRRQALLSTTSSSSSQQSPPLWNITLRGGVVQLTHGKPKNAADGTEPLYPLEALLTVFSTASDAQWALLSIEVRAQAKTGESNHQLDTTNRQRFDLHRLCAKAMQKEEARAEGSRGMDATTTTATDTNSSSNATVEEQPPARPLDCLFQVAHRFALSWQLEILSAQAQALRKGVWSSATSLSVTPVQFSNRAGDDTIGIMSIAFWRVDDRHGPPSLGNLQQEQNEESAQAQSRETSLSSPVTNKPPANQLVLMVRAVSHVGMRVSLSGGGAILKQRSTHQHIDATVEKLVDAASNPFALSASNALLAATLLCAEQKCHSIVEALRKNNKQEGDGSTNSAATSVLPPWMMVHVERTSIAVSAKVKYGNSTSDFLVLFRLACDARTGNFIATMDRSFPLLRRLSSNDIASHETLALRQARMTSSRRSGGGGALSTTGRLVKDAMQGLNRSMNVLGLRAGVGEWNNHRGDVSVQLRQKEIQTACRDVRVSLMNVCTMASVYGLSALALGVATGIEAGSDLAGSAIMEQQTAENGQQQQLQLLPPVGIVLNQEMIQRSVSVVDGKKKLSLIQRNVFGLTGHANDTALVLRGVDATVVVQSPSELGTRENCTLVELASSSSSNPIMDINGEPPAAKKQRFENGGGNKNSASNGGNDDHHQASHNYLYNQVGSLAAVLSSTAIHNQIT